MPHSKSAIYVHIVWATWEREPMITEMWSNRIYGCIRSIINDQSCEPIALGGMPDHIHALVRLRPTVAVASLVKRIKGASSRMMNEQLTGASAFKWQRGYGAFSLSFTDLDAAEYYVRNQEHHHTVGAIWPVWEETPDADD